MTVRKRQKEGCHLVRIIKDRSEAGRELAEKLKSLKIEEAHLIALPRGGIPVGLEIAKALKVPLDVLISRKVGVPQNPEFGVGACTEEDYYWLDSKVLSELGYSEQDMMPYVRREFKEVARRVKLYRKGRNLPDLKGKSILLIDDGIATGVTAKVAAHYLKSKGAKEVILAVPVAPRDSLSELTQHFDKIICLRTPEPFYSVGTWYEDFSQLTDDEVIAFLSLSPTENTKEDNSFDHKQLQIKVDNVLLTGDLNIPSEATGLVIFAHGSGSGRLSPRNQEVARALNQQGLGTLLFDLLSEEEGLDRRNVFNIPFLASRLVSVVKWLQRRGIDDGLALGFFGASTGGGAALWAAAELKDQIKAVVSRGGRPDLAFPRLAEVQAPTLLLVGGNDFQVIELNKQALQKLKNGELKIIHGASHLFEEPGAMAKVSERAALWFKVHFQSFSRRTSSG